MKERPILFSGPMVRAILEGRKTVTRRVVKPAFPASVVEVQPFAGDLSAWMPVMPGPPDQPWEEQIRTCPYGKPCDRLWVRESHAQVFEVDIPEGRPVGPIGTSGSPGRPGWKCRYVYRADGEMPNVQWHHIGDSQPVRWTPSIHMPRDASRILLEITNVRVERLQDITEEQAVAEGVDRPENIRDVDVWDGAERELFNAMNQPRDRFKRLWADINGAESWDANPWVWVVEFKRVEAASV